MKIKLILIAFIVFALTGCYDSEHLYTYYDTTIYGTAFADCEKNLPVGPEVTHYNDWDEVVDSCSRVAIIQAGRTGTSEEGKSHPTWVLRY